MMDSLTSSKIPALNKMKVQLKENFKPIKSITLKKGAVLESDYVGNQLMVRYKQGKYAPINHNQIKIIEPFCPF